MDSTKNTFRKILDKVILAAVLLLACYLFVFLFGWIGKKANTSVVTISITTSIVKAIFYLFMLLGVTYNSFWSKKTLAGKGRKLLFYTGNVLVVFVLFCWFIFYAESKKLYEFLKNPVMLSERLFQTNPQLGYSPIPNNTGNHHYDNGQISVNIPAVTDAEGHRTYTQKYIISNDTTLLFLGCSFSWGDYSLAEETFAYLTAKKMHSSYVNAGVSGYGLAQMLLLAKELIAQKKPAYVVAQYSPWLADRATAGFTPTFFGTRFSPYFAKAEGKDTLALPAYLSYLDEVPFEYYKHSEPSTKDKISFLKNVGWPVLFKPYVKKLLFNTKVALGRVPKPNSNKEEVERYFYQSLLNICKASNARLVVLNVNAAYDNGYTKDKFCQLVGRDNCGQILFADAHSALCKGVKDNGEYISKYAHQKDGVIYDGHPNREAAEIISNEIVKTIQNK
jgi:hypothetical protein